jgi:hypothetical protein
MHNQHIVVLRGERRADKPVVLAGSEGMLGTALKAFIPATRGQYFRVRSGELHLLCGDERPVSAIRPLAIGEIPGFVQDLGAGVPVVVTYDGSSDSYGVFHGWNAPRYLSWCLGMVSSMFAESSVFSSVSSFVGAVAGKPRWKTALKEAAKATRYGLRQVRAEGAAWMELDFNGEVSRSAVVRHPGTLDPVGAVVEIWGSHVARVSPAGSCAPQALAV